MSRLSRFAALLMLAAVLAACAPLAPAANPAAGSGSTMAGSNATGNTNASASATSAPAVGDTAAPAVGGTVTRALTSEPTSLDPHGPAGSGQNVILPYLYDTLVYRDGSNQYHPYLAESWETAPDGKSVTFKLRQDVKFTDGTPLDADAVVFTYQRFKEKGGKSPVAPGILDIKAIEAVDAYTVRFTFDQPSSIFFSTISMPYAGILSPTAVKAEGDKFGQQPVGSGPFKLEKWQPGVAVTLVRNADYKWGPAAAIKNQSAPYVEHLVFKAIPDAGTQLTALQTGDVDMIYINDPGQIATLRQDKNVSLNEATMNSLVYLSFNCRKAPFDDPRVRQALSYAINKDDIVKTALGGVGKAAFAPLAPTLPGFDPSLKQYELGYDAAKAEQLLTAAGLTRGADDAWSRNGQKLTLTLLTSTRAPNEAIATMLQSQFKAIGIDVQIQQLDSAAATDAATKGKFDLFLWRYDWNDADVLLSYLGSAQIGRTNRSFYSNKQVDDLLNKAMHEPDAKARQQLYVDAQKLIMADAPWQPLYTPVDVLAIRTRVAGAIVGPMGRAIMNDARVAGK